MGDRANVVIKETYQEKTNYVFLYTHWRGYSLPHLVQAALQRRCRWSDGAYLTRIIFDGMTDGEQGGELGFGIWPSICDNEHKLIVVDPEELRIGFTGNPTWEARASATGVPREMIGYLRWRRSEADTYKDPSPEDVKSWWTFEEYCTLTEEEIRKAYE